ncbi:MAG: hypothetical protein KGN34_04725 [Sphingomonadales bacterium]|nr:hypothetical protein [Sphingomonadales bacterium]
MSTVRTALLKIAAIGAGAALAGGGAVHFAEKAHNGKPQYVKHAKKPAVHVVHKPAPPRPQPRMAIPTCPVGTMPAPADYDTNGQMTGANGNGATVIIRCIETRTTAVAPLPPPYVAPPQQPPVEERTRVRTRVVHEDLYDHGFGGGFFNGFFGGSSGGVYIVPGGSTSTSTSNGSSGSSSTSTSTSTGSSTSTSTSTSSSTSSGGTPVPAPPMLALFGMAAASLAGRRKLAKQQA